MLLGDTMKVVGVHSGAISTIEGQVLALVGTGGIIGLITGGAVGTALSIANSAKSKANEAHTKIDDLIISTTTDKADTSNFIIDTSNILITDYDNKILNTSNYTRNTSNILITDYNNKILNTSNYTRNISNILSTRINNLNSATIGNIFPLLYNNHFEQISDGLNPNQISIKNINSVGRFDYAFLKIPPAPGFLNYSVNGWLLSPSSLTNIISGGLTAGSRLNKLFISSVSNSTPIIINDTMFHHLQVEGSTRINGMLITKGAINIEEDFGTTAGANSGSLILDHGNNGGVSSITFRSRVNRGSDFGYIQYQDATEPNGGGESARLIIGTSNDADDHIILNPGLGNVGIGTNNPNQKLTVSGNIEASGEVIAGPSYNGGFYSGDINWGFRIHNFGNENWTEAKGYWHQSGRGFRCFNAANNTVPFSVDGTGATSINGSLYLKIDTWHHAGNRQVAYYESTGRNYYKGGSTDTSMPPHIWRNRDDSNIVSFTHWGEVRASGGFTNISDTRIKKDIVDIDDTEALEKILLVQPKKYKYIDETKGTHEVIGFIAQQIKEIIPHAVNLGEGTLPNGEEVQDFHYLDKMIIYTLNVAATQELHRIITRQQTVIDSLILRLEALENS